MLTKGLATLMLILCIPALIGCSNEEELEKSQSMVDSVLGENEPEDLDIKSIMDGASED